MKSLLSIKYSRGQVSLLIYYLEFLKYTLKKIYINNQDNTIDYLYINSYIFSLMIAKNRNDGNKGTRTLDF